MILKTSWEEIGRVEIRRPKLWHRTPTKHKSKQQHDRHLAKTIPRKKRIQFSRL